MIEIKDVWKSFDEGKTYAVRGVTFSISEGEIIVLLGSSGSGKTTTLKMINRLIEPTRGEIFVDGTDVRELNRVRFRRSIGYVFQGIGLFPHFTVAENVSIVLKLIGIPKKNRRDRASELLELMGLDPTKDGNRFPGELSGGQQQRVGVARALAADPKFLLMDEPFGALDAITRETLQFEVIRLRNQLRKTIVFVTHDILEAFCIADRIAVMHNGMLEQIGTKDQLLASPASDFVEQLLTNPIKRLSQISDQLQTSINMNNCNSQPNLMS